MLTNSLKIILKNLLTFTAFRTVLTRSISYKQVHRWTKKVFIGGLTFLANFVTFLENFVLREFIRELRTFIRGKSVTYSHVVE